jgi:hypothetical protein
MDTISGSVCRLCGGVLEPAFRATIMDKYEIGYFKCLACESLQTEPPHWLEEAYDSHLGQLDLGAVQRNLANQAACCLTARLWGCRNALDYGGGDGLLCRMLRDHGVNCYVSDKYGDPTYAQTFTEPDFATPDIVFSFEVFEHFARPAHELAEVFDRGATVILASTGLYRGQGPDWFYLSRASGRHVFFYSPKAIGQIGERFGYAATISGPYLLFVRPAAARPAALTLFKASTRKIGLRLLRIWMSALPVRGVAADTALMRRRGLDPT